MTPPSLARQIIHPRCPRCGEGRLFKDSLSIVEECSACHLVLKHHDAADGPAFFALVIVGFLVMGGAALVEISFSPPLWLHALLWVPLTFLLTYGCLRAFKTLLITIEYRLTHLKSETPHE